MANLASFDRAWGRAGQEMMSRMLLREAQPREGSAGGGCSDTEHNRPVIPVWLSVDSRKPMIHLATGGPHLGHSISSLWPPGSSTPCRAVPDEASGRSAFSAGKGFTVLSIFEPRDSVVRLYI